MVFGFLLPTLAGHAAGGTMLLAVVSYAQGRKKIEERSSPRRLSSTTVLMPGGVQSEALELHRISFADRGESHDRRPQLASRGRGIGNVAALFQLLPRLLQRTVQQCERLGPKESCNLVKRHDAVLPKGVGKLSCVPRACFCRFQLP